MIGIIEDLSGDWRRLDDRIERVTEEIEQLAHGSESCRQLMTVPGIGPLIASAMVAAIANGAAFAKGRDFAAWLGLVPKQMLTGESHSTLGTLASAVTAIHERLFMQGAWVILPRPANWARHSSGLGGLWLKRKRLAPETFWQLHSPRSWRASRGRSWPKSANRPDETKMETEAATRALSDL